MVSARLERRIGQETVDGWTLVAVDGEHAILRRRTVGSKMAHLLVAALTLWWTFGLGNLAYAAHHYLNRAEYRVVSATDPLDEVDAMAHLRRRYAAGKIDEEAFEHAVEQLLQTSAPDEDRALELER